MKGPGTTFLLITFTFSTLVMGQSSASSTPPTMSPLSEFIARPTNVTVLEGQPAVLRCKLKDNVHNCQWFHLALGLDIVENRKEASLVKQFRPSKSKDCSIKFSSTKKIQTGQWICKGLQIHAQKYVVSEPAILRVISIDGDEPESGKAGSEGENAGGRNEEDLSFMVSEEGHIINTKLGDAAVIGCLANKGLHACSWIKPDGGKMSFPNAMDDNYSLEGNYTEGNCSLLISRVSARDEGNWRCVVSVANATGDNLGPLIHLHVLEFGVHSQGAQGFSGERRRDSSLVTILVVTSVVLLVVIAALVAYMYKHVWRRGASPHHKHLDSTAGDNIDYSQYGSTKWLPSRRGSKDQQLIYDSLEMQQQQHSNEYTRYLDMTGKGSVEGYVAFPPNSSPRSSSMGSKATTVSLPTRASQSALGAPDSDESHRASGGASLHSASTVGNPTYNQEWIQGRGLPERQESVCSEGHLYEEIDETKMRRKIQEEAPAYANIDEDQEGYMIPKNCSMDESIVMEAGQCEEKHEDKENSEHLPSADETDKKEELSSSKAPPYSRVGEKGLVVDSEAVAAVGEERPSGPADSAGGAGDDEESYDVPSDPPVPIRVDSIDNPLAEYDVPRKSSPGTLPVYV